MKWKVSSPFRACPVTLLGVYIPVGTSADVDATQEQIDAAKLAVDGLCAEPVKARKSKTDDASE